MEKFTVAIVGASIAGLTLAKLLEQLGINFIVLEAYDQIAPQVGASIGLHPNGLRVLDQLGCYEDLLMRSAAADQMTTRTSDGKVLYSHSINRHIKDRHGYEVLFLERRVAIEILWEKLQNKAKVHPGQRVTRVEESNGKVQLHTKAGHIFEADIAVGADGIHSTLRQEMWRLAKQRAPAHFNDDNCNPMRTEYGCIFGISKPTGNLKATEVHLTHKKDTSLAVMVGPKNVPYWFLFFKLKEPHLGISLPRYTEDDEISIVSKDAETRVTNDIVFGQLYKNVSFSTITPLPHHVFKTWYFGRIMLIGDSVHKFNPISGQGGNSAIESAAVLADQIHSMIARTSGKPTLEQITSTFQETQDLRRKRVTMLVEESIKAQRFSAWDSAIFKVLDTHIASRINTPLFIDQISQPIVDAARSRTLGDQSFHVNPSRSLPFNDELPATQQSLRWPALAAVFALVGMLSFAVHVLVLKSAEYGTIDALDAIVKAGYYPGKKQQMMNFDHIPILGSCISYLIAVYFPGTESWDVGFQLLTFYLSISELIVFATWAVESCRVCNAAKPSRAALLFGCLSNVTAIAFGTPLYYLLDIVTTLSPEQWWLTSAYVPPSKSKAILPAVIIGMLIPTLLMFAPFLPSIPRQYMAILWMFSPIWFHILQQYFAKRYAIEDEQSTTQTLATSMARSVKHLKKLYCTIGIISTVTHVVVVALALRSSQASLSRIFHFRYSDGMSVYEGNHAMFLCDFYVTLGATLVWVLFKTVSLGRSGIAHVNSMTLLSSVLVGSVLVGPAATAAACCYWRDSQLVQNRSNREGKKIA